MQQQWRSSLVQLAAWLSGLVALYIVTTSLPESITSSAAWQAVLVGRWPWYAGGAMVAAVVLLLLARHNHLLGVSTGFSELCNLGHDPAARTSWRPSFLVGVVLGGVAAAILSGATPSSSLGELEMLLGPSAMLQIPVLLAAGLAIGYGSRVAGGCTSGHGIVGTAQLARSSLTATSIFIVTGIAVVHALLWFRA